MSNAASVCKLQSAATVCPEGTVLNRPDASKSVVSWTSTAICSLRSTPQSPAPSSSKKCEGAPTGWAIVVPELELGPELMWRTCSGGAGDAVEPLATLDTDASC